MAKAASRFIKGISKGAMAIVAVGPTMGCASQKTQPFPFSETVASDGTIMAQYKGDSIYACQKMGRDTAARHHADSTISCDVPGFDIAPIFGFRQDGRFRPLKLRGT